MASYKLYCIIKYFVYSIIAQRKYFIYSVVRTEYFVYDVARTEYFVYGVARTFYFWHEKYFITEHQVHRVTRYCTAEYFVHKVARRILHYGIFCRWSCTKDIVLRNISSIESHGEYYTRNISSIEPYEEYCIVKYFIDSAIRKILYCGIFYS